MVACTKRFAYPFASIGDLEVRTVADPKSGRTTATEVIVDGESVTPTDRFWLSLYARFRFNKSFFRFFSHAEVFRRITEVEPRDRVRLCIERDGQTGESRLLAASSPTKAILRHDDLMDTLDSYEGENVRYGDGVVESTHVPRIGGNMFDVGGDKMCNRFVVSAPIDGYGLPSIYLSLLREICSNGMVGYSPTFRSTLALGRGEDNAVYSIVRALDGFSSDEGYAALRQRFEAAAKSWASVAEAQSLYRVVTRILPHGEFRWQSRSSTELLHAVNSAGGSTQPIESTETGDVSRVDARVPVLAAFHRMTGDVSQIYGLANVDALSAKRQRALPVNCRVYDLLNFASELATHHTSGSASRSIQAWIGTLISREYDLEESCDTFCDFRDFFLDRKLNGELAMDLQRIGG